MKNFKFLIAVGFCFALSTAMHAADPPADKDNRYSSQFEEADKAFDLAYPDHEIHFAMELQRVEETLPIVSHFALHATVQHIDVPALLEPEPVKRPGSYNYIRDLNKELDTKMHPAERLRL